MAPTQDHTSASAEPEPSNADQGDGGTQKPHVILLNPEEELHMNRGACKPVVAAALKSQDAKTAITLLGQAVA